MRTSTPVRMRDCTVTHAGHSARSTHVAEPRVWRPGAWNGTLKAPGSAQAHASTAWSAGTQEGLPGANAGKFTVRTLTKNYGWPLVAYGTEYNGNLINRGATQWPGTD